jgi:glycosyltransferase involved in cell wall biosynthesis
MNIVITSPSLPYVAGKGHESHGYQRLRALAQRGHAVTLVCFGSRQDPQSESKIKNLASLGIRCRVVPSGVASRALRVGLSFWAKNLPAQVAWYKSKAFKKRLEEAVIATKADVVHCITARIACNLPASMRTPLSIDFIDSLGLNFQRRSQACSLIERPFFRREAASIARFEKHWAEAADLGFVVSAIDRDVIDSRSLRVLPVGVDLERFAYFEKKESSVQSICFTGNMNYAPNDAAARWFIASSWAQIQKCIPSCTFIVAGRKPSVSLQRLARRHPGVQVLGEVDSMQRVLHESSIAVAPMTLGSGMQNKILEAMAVGTPVVTNRLGLGDIRAVAGTDIMCAEGSVGIANAVVSLLKNPLQRLSMAENARTYVEMRHNWNSINGCFEEQIVTLAHRGRRQMPEFS